MTKTENECFHYCLDIGSEFGKRTYMEDPENICPMKMLYHVLEPYTTLVSIDEDELGPIGDTYTIAVRISI